MKEAGSYFDPLMPMNNFFIQYIPPYQDMQLISTDGRNYLTERRFLATEAGRELKKPRPNSNK